MAKVNWTQALSDYASDEKQSYQTIANKHGVSKRSVVKRAAKENWQLVRRETALKVHQKLPEMAAESIVEVNLRHAYIGRSLQILAIEAMRLKNISPDNQHEAIAALKAGIEIERTALGLDNRKPHQDVAIHLTGQAAKWAK